MAQFVNSLPDPSESQLGHQEQKKLQLQPRPEGEVQISLQLQSRRTTPVPPTAKRTNDGSCSVNIHERWDNGGVPKSGTEACHAVENIEGDLPRTKIYFDTPPQPFHIA